MVGLLVRAVRWSGWPAPDNLTVKRARRTTLAQVETALRSCGGLQAHAARQLGITRQSLNERVHRYPALRALVENERELVLDDAEWSLRQAVTAGEAWAVCFTLKTLGRSRGYVERREVTGADGGPIAIREILIRMPDEVEQES